MKSEIKVPAMGESITEAIVGEIFKLAGSSVAVDDELLELETDKVNQILYAQQAGVISWKVSKGETVKIGQTLGAIDSAAAKSAGTAPVAPSKPKEESSSAAPAAPQTKVETGATARLTKEAFVAEITAPEKKTPTLLPQQPASKSSAVAAEQPNGRKETRQKMSRIRQVISQRLVEAKQTTAMLTTFNEIDMTQVLLQREKYKEVFQKQYGVKLGFMSFFVKAVIAALEESPGLNSYIEGNEIVHRGYYDIGIAVSTDRGLVVPVVRDCQKLSFAEIERAIEVYAKKSREGGLSVDDMQGGGFTITNGGVYGSLLSTPILNPPQSGILGMHKIQKRPVVVNDEIVIRSMMYIALSYDHRIVDGKEAVTFLVAVKNFLEDPARLILQI